MKKISKIFSVAFLSVVFVGLPSLILAQSNVGTGATDKTVKIRLSGVVPICYTGNESAPVDVPCESFDILIVGIKKLLSWAVNFTLMFSVVVIAYAGYLYLTSASNPGNRGKANKMFVSVAKGIFFILAAWLIVTLIINALVDNSIGIKNILQ